MIGRLTSGLLGLGAACVAYGTFIESTAYQVRRFTVPVLPAGAAPLRVLHITDIHLLPSQQRKRDFLRGLGGLEPDLVVNTGDNISSPDAVEPLIESLGRLAERPGVFVFGSNDFEGPRFKLPLRYVFRGHHSRIGGTSRPMPADDLRAAFERIGWVDLDNRRAELTIKGQQVSFRGTGDAHHDLDDYDAVAGPAASDHLEIGVTHAPYLRVLDSMAADGVPLVLAGHTHGGQVCVPGHGALTSNCDLPPALAKGMFGHVAGGHTAQVHVSAGIGMSPFAPYRFACPPEVSLLTLVPAPAPM